MSVPAANALSPAPVIISARTLPGSPAISARRSYIGKLRELGACGRLGVRGPLRGGVCLVRCVSVDFIGLKFVGVSLGDPGVFLVELSKLICVNLCASVVPLP